ncbi:MAG: hypothetical protein V1835_02975 [Candidatus Micrarchaeota archaeon]
MNLFLPAKLKIRLTRKIVVPAALAGFITISAGLFSLLHKNPRDIVVVGPREACLSCHQNSDEFGKSFSDSLKKMRQRVERFTGKRYSKYVYYIDSSKYVYFIDSDLGKKIGPRGALTDVTTGATYFGHDALENPLRRFWISHELAQGMGDPWNPYYSNFADAIAIASNPDIVKDLSKHPDVYGRAQVMQYLARVAALNHKTPPGGTESYKYNGEGLAKWYEEKLTPEDFERTAGILEKAAKGMFEHGILYEGLARDLGNPLQLLDIFIAKKLAAADSAFKSAYDYIAGSPSKRDTLVAYFDNHMDSVSSAGANPKDLADPRRQSGDLLSKVQRYFIEKSKQGADRASMVYYIGVWARYVDRDGKFNMDRFPFDRYNKIAEGRLKATNPLIKGLEDALKRGEFDGIAKDVARQRLDAYKTKRADYEKASREANYRKSQRILE